MSAGLLSFSKAPFCPLNHKNEHSYRTILMRAAKVRVAKILLSWEGICDAEVYLWGQLTF